MINIEKKQAQDLAAGDIVGDADAAWYVVVSDAHRASRATGCQARVQHVPDGGIAIREWDDEHHEVPVRVEA